MVICSCPKFSNPATCDSLGLYLPYKWSTPASLLISNVLFLGKLFLKEYISGNIPFYFVYISFFNENSFCNYLNSSGDPASGNDKIGNQKMCLLPQSPLPGMSRPVLINRNKYFGQYSYIILPTYHCSMIIASAIVWFLPGILRPVMIKLQTICCDFCLHLLLRECYVRYW